MTLLSWATFVAGAGMIIAGVVVALVPPAHVNPTVISSVFGATGAISALGAVYASVKQGIREVTVDVARLRMVLTAFATQLGQLRALAEAPPDKTNPKPPTLATVADINKAIASVTNGALSLIPAISDASAAGTNAGRSSSRRGAQTAAKPKATNGTPKATAPTS